MNPQFPSFSAGPTSAAPAAFGGVMAGRTSLGGLNAIMRGMSDTAIANAGGLGPNPSALGGFSAAQMPHQGFPSAVPLPTTATATGLLAREQLLAAEQRAFHGGAGVVPGAVTSASPFNRAGGVLLADEELLRLVGTSRKLTGKGSRPKKPKDMPKRPLSAYNIFFKEERAKILNDIPAPLGYPGPEEQPEGEGNKSDKNSDAHPNGGEGSAGQGEDKQRQSSRQRAPHGKIGFENLAKTIGRRWKSLASDRLEHYKKLADEDMERYKAAMDVYHQTQAEKRRVQEEEESKRKSLINERRREQEHLLGLQAKRIQESQIKLLAKQQQQRKRKVEAVLPSLGGTATTAGPGGLDPSIAAAVGDSNGMLPTDTESYIKRMRLAAAGGGSASSTQEQQQLAAEEIALRMRAEQGYTRKNENAAATNGLLRENLLLSGMREGVSGMAGGGPGVGGGLMGAMSASLSPDRYQQLRMIQQQQQDLNAAAAEARAGLPNAALMESLRRGSYM